MLKKVGIFLFIIIFTFVFQANAYAQSPAINNGLSWLSINQNPDGSWAGTDASLNSPYSTTSEVIDTIYYIDSTLPSYSLGFQWLTGQAVSPTEFLSRIIISLSQNGIDTTEDVSMLLSYQNASGGWGEESEFYNINNIFDTSLALQALKSANYSDQNVISSAINYLISNQNTDGGFGFYSGDESNVYMTAIVSYTLQQFSQTTSIATALNHATSYFTAHQNTDGGFGSTASTIYETALAYIALFGETTDNTVLGNAVNHLMTNQLSNGSWNDDPYSTALALRALYISENGLPLVPQPTTEIEPIYIGPSDSFTTMTGKVTDASTGNPIANADVVISGTDLSTGSGQVFSVKADSAGTYTITGVNLLEFTLKASATGYDSKAYAITITIYGTYAADFALNQSKVSDLRIVSLITDQEIYSANTDVIITSTVENTGSTPIDALIAVYINDNQGNTIAIAYPATQEITINPLSSNTINMVWNTDQFGPGYYEIILKAMDPATVSEGNLPQTVLAEKKGIITIQASVGIANAAIRLTPNFTYVNATENVAVALSLTNKSNITTTLTIEYTIKSPSGVILNNGSVTAPLTLDMVTATIPLAAFNYNFNESGEYPIDVVIYKDGTVLSSISSIFPVLSNIRIEMKRTVTPETVLPSGSGKVKITIELNGVDEK